MKTKETFTRKEAIRWWNQKDFDIQMNLCIKYHDKLINGKIPSTITGREIESIWSVETVTKQPNKQFTEFNKDAVLAYIAKFKSEHLTRFFETVYSAIPNNLKWDGVNYGADFHMHISRAYNAGRQAQTELFHHQLGKGLADLISSTNVPEPNAPSSIEYFDKEFIS